MLRGRLDRALGASAVAGLFLLGIGELIARLAEPMPLLFWLPTLWGGAALIAGGGFMMTRGTGLAKVLLLIGCALGLVPSLWTLVMPALLVTLALRALGGPQILGEHPLEP